MAPMKPEPGRRDCCFEGTISLAELARRWKISRKELRRLLAEQRLDFVQIRGRLRVPVDEAERFERHNRRGKGAG